MHSALNVQSALGTPGNGIEARIVQTNPHASAVSWALVVGGPTLGRTGEPPAALLVLMACAHHAEARLCSGDGYWNVNARTLVNVLGLSESTCRKYLRLLNGKGLLRAFEDGFRLPDAALDGSWAL